MAEEATDEAPVKISVRDRLKNFQTNDKNVSLSTLRPQQHLQYVVTTHKKGDLSRSQTTNYSAERLRASSGGSADIINNINKVKSKLRRRTSSEVDVNSSKEARGQCHRHIFKLIDF